MGLHDSTDPSQISLASLPPTPQQTRAACAGAAVLLLGLAVLLPFAAKPLPKIVGFIPALDAVISVTDFITAGLLLAHFSITRSRLLWVLACGYLFSAEIVVAHGLTFPGAFSPTGDFTGSSHTNFRIYLLWHLGLPMDLFTYVWLRNKNRTKAGARTATEIVATVGVVGVVALMSCIACLVILPPVDPVVGRWLTVITMVVCATALSVLWVFKRSALDQWLMIVMLAMIIELAITALIGGRGPRIVTVGFYTGRLFSLVTSTVVLIALLADTSRLYAGVARTHMLANVVKASQLLSSEIELPKLIERLMTIAVENAGADRCLLILPVGDDYLIQAEARRTSDHIEVTMRQEPITGMVCPESLVRYVIQTQKSVVLDDASKPSLFSTDDYLRDRQSKSILCLPLIKQRELTGILLLENTLTSHAFNAGRIGVLELLSTQAVISLENTRLYNEAKERQARVRRLVDSNIIGIFIWDIDGQIIDTNDAFLHMIGRSHGDIGAGHTLWRELTPAEWRDTDEQRLEDLKTTGIAQPYEKEFFKKDGTRVPVLVGAAIFEDASEEGVAFVVDLTDRKRAEASARESEGRYHEGQMQLAHANRVASIGHLSASIAHELNQPLSGIITNASTCLRMLAANPPDVDGACETARRTIRDGNRASDVVTRLRSLFANKDAVIESVDMNEAVREVIALSLSELQINRVILRPEFAEDLPPVAGDRVQLQQVILNLLRNASDAMSDVDNRPRLLVIRTEREEGHCVRLTVQDSGVGLAPQGIDKLFEAFYTTKSGGMGVGLSVCRSIIESHQGHLWASPNDGPGATFSFTLPREPEGVTEAG